MKITLDGLTYRPEFLLRTEISEKRNISTQAAPDLRMTSYFDQQ
jgi:hypothetical protein